MSNLDFISVESKPKDSVRVYNSLLKKDIGRLKYDFASAQYFFYPNFEVKLNEDDMVSIADCLKSLS